MINLHVMLMMLALKVPQQPKELELIPAPQIVCPMSLFEDKITWKELRIMQEIKKHLNERI